MTEMEAVERTTSSPIEPSAFERRARLVALVGLALFLVITMLVEAQVLGGAPRMRNPFRVERFFGRVFPG